MGIIHTFTYYFSYFFILIIALLISILLAKKLYAWVPYTIGAFVTFLSISGNQKSAEFLGISGLYDSEWNIYFCLLLIGAVIILLRYNRAKKAAIKLQDNIKSFEKETSNNTEIVLETTEKGERKE